MIFFAVAAIAVPLACSGKAMRVGVGNAEAGSGPSVEAGAAGEPDSDPPILQSGGGSGALSAGAARGGHAGDPPPIGGTFSSGGGASSAGSDTVSAAGSDFLPDEEGCGGILSLPGCGMCPPVEDIIPADELPERERGQDEVACDAHAEDMRLRHEESRRGAILSVAPLAGTWGEGNGENRIELALDAQGAGTLRVGDAAAIPEIEAPEETFLVGDSIQSVLVEGLVPGFRYTVLAEIGRGSELQFHVFTADAWGEWCSLQIPVRQDNCYACALIEQVSQVRGCGELNGCYSRVPETEKFVPVDCIRQQLCALYVGDDGVCQCTREECFPTDYGKVEFTATLDPVDPSVLRLTSTSYERSYYLTKE